MSGLVTLPQFLQRETIENKRNKGHFEDLLKLLKDIYLKSTEPKVLDDVAISLAHLLRNDETRMHNVEALIQTIVEDLLRRMSGSGSRMSSQGSSKRGGSQKSKRGEPLSASQDEDFSAGLVLLQLCTLAKKLDLKDYIDEDIETVSQNVQTVINARLDGDDWSADKQRLQWTVRVVKEGISLLWVLLLHAERDLLALVKEEKKPNSYGTTDEEDDDFAADQVKTIIALREVLISILTRVLAMDMDDASVDEETTSGGGGSGQRKKKPQTVIGAMQEVKKFAYQIVSDCRTVFRPAFVEYQVSDGGLGGIV